MPRARKYRQATFFQTLYEYDGPKLVLLKTPGTSYIIGASIVNNLYDEPFYGAEISFEQLNGLAAEEYGVRFLFLRPKFKQRFIFDLADLDEGDEINLLPLGLTPDTIKYLPGRTLFASDFTDEVRTGGAAQPKAEERILVDGNWEISDFNDLYGGYSDLYSFTDALEKFQDNNTPINSRKTIKTAFDKQWQGGGSYGSFYKSMRGVQSASERLSLAGFEYHSPGFVDFEGQKELLVAVTESLKDFGERHAEIAPAYKDLYQYLQINKLLSLPADKFDTNSDLATNVAERGLEFSKILPGGRWTVLLGLADGNQLVATKVLLSLYRRLNRLNDFQLQGRVTF